MKHPTLLYQFSKYYDKFVNKYFYLYNLSIIPYNFEVLHLYIYILYVYKKLFSLL